MRPAWALRNKCFLHHRLSVFGHWMMLNDTLFRENILLRNSLTCSFMLTPNTNNRQHLWHLRQHQLFLGEKYSLVEINLSLVRESLCQRITALLLNTDKPAKKGRLSPTPLSVEFFKVIKVALSFICFLPICVFQCVRRRHGKPLRSSGTGCQSKTSTSTGSAAAWQARSASWTSAASSANQRSTSAWSGAWVHHFHLCWTH